MILIALGANLPSRFGTPAQTLAAARQAMEAAGLKIIKASADWLTAPVPVSDQPWFHNAIVAVETSLDAFQILSVLQNIENDFGRTRVVRNEARILDLDLIAYHDQVIDSPSLIVPHPRMHQRAFVLMPLREIAPDWKHPILTQSLNDLIGVIPSDQQAVMANAS